MLIIGIAGGTGSGKTTVVNKIMESLPSNEVALLSQDSYYKDSSHLSMEERQEINFDHPDSIEFELLTQHLLQLKKNETIQEPAYDYITCCRLPQTKEIKPKKVILVEGILVFTWPALRDLFDVKIFVAAEADDRLIRVMQRDSIERGRTVEKVIERYHEVLKPMHDQFIEPTKRFADIIVPQGGNNTVAIDVLRQLIQMNLISHAHV